MLIILMHVRMNLTFGVSAELIILIKNCTVRKVATTLLNQVSRGEYRHILVTFKV